MTPRELETRWLSLRFWLLRCVAPSTLTLIALLVALNLWVEDSQYRDQTALIFCFFIVYFTLIRGGHLLMIRSMHSDLLKTYGKKYETELKALPADLRRQNLGFTLARIKRKLITSAQGVKRS